MPICLLHGWPGSVLEFLHFLNVIERKCTPQELQYNYIVPSQPGYAISSGPSVSKEWKIEDIAYVIHELILGLGFGESGHVAHGGDIGNFISQILAVWY